MVNNADLVSVIIPTYNRAEPLLDALASVRCQTWPHIQIIIADDGSTDDTASLVAGMPDIVYVRQEHRGQGAARNLGLRHAQGAYICSLDSDDVWKPDFIETSLYALRMLKADFVFSNWTEQTATGETCVSYFEENNGWNSYRTTELEGWRMIDPAVARKTYMDSCISPSSSLFLPRDLIQEGWNEDIKIVDDWYLLGKIVLSKPCHVAVSTQARWMKRIYGDNVSYQPGESHAKRYTFVQDFCLMLRQLGPLMKASERAWLCVRIAFHQLVLARWELAEKRLTRVPTLLSRAFKNMIDACLLSPGVVFRCVWELGKRRKANRVETVFAKRYLVLGSGVIEPSQSD